MHHNRGLFVLKRVFPLRWGVICGVPLALLAVTLATGIALFRSAPAHADALLHRLETVENANGALMHRWSDDGGSTWSAWNSLQPLVYQGNTHTINDDSFTGTPAAISDGVARLTVVGRTNEGSLVYNTFNNGPWSGWGVLPGSNPPDPVTGVAPGSNPPILVTSPGSGVTICTYFLGDCNDETFYTFTSDPVLTSWGPGRMELFIYGLRQSDGAKALLHTWADNYTWSGNWESLGTGLMQGNPAAVSWGPGRTDVFIWGDENDLSHKWFDNGQWSSGWENLGCTLTSSPTATSDGAGLLHVFARGAGGDLITKWFNGTWNGCASLGGGILTGTSPSGTSLGAGLDEVFVIGTDGNLYHQDYNNGWSGWINDNSPASNLTAVAWVPVSAPLPDPPTATPSPSCGRAGQPPCHVDP